MIIVESKKEWDIFLSHWGNYPSIIFPVWKDPFLRPNSTDLSFLYIRFPNEEFILPIDHNDCQSFKWEASYLFLSNQTKTIWDKKSFLQTELGRGMTNLFDLQSYSFFLQNELKPIDDEINNLTSFWTRMGEDRNLGKIIPIVKWISVFQKLNLTPSKTLNSLWVNDKIIPILSEIEKLGLPVDRKKFLDKWPHLPHLLNEVNGETRVYTEYNPYTMTSRPTNRHGGINWGALNKEDGTRRIISAGDGKELFMLDYDAYHLRLIAKLLKIPVPQTSLHQQFADEWGISYKEAKSRTFRILYGGANEEDKKINFFRVVDEALKEWGAIWRKRGYIQTAAGRLIYNKWIQDWTPIKGFNYLLQATETEFNMQTLLILKENNLPLPIMYNYDSFMWELPKDSTNMAHQLRHVIEKNGFPAKGSWGKTYDDL